MQWTTTHKDKPPDPLYKIHYLTKAPRKGWQLAVKVIHFQTEDQYQSWLKKRYAIVQETYDVQIEKRNDVPPNEGRE
jgi:hypothetical protein